MKDFTGHSNFNLFASIWPGSEQQAAERACSASGGSRVGGKSPQARTPAKSSGDFRCVILAGLERQGRPAGRPAPHPGPENPHARLRVAGGRGVVASAARTLGLAPGVVWSPQIPSFCFLRPVSPQHTIQSSSASRGNLNQRLIWLLVGIWRLG